MTAMNGPITNGVATPLPRADGTELARMQIERALVIAGSEEHPLASTVAQAAESAGADLLLMLPALDGDGVTAVVRVSDATGERFLQVQIGAAGVTVREADQIEANLLSLARASVEVFQRIGADEAIRAPLAAA